MADPYISPRQAIINKLKTPGRDLTNDAAWLISELERVDWLLEELKDRIDDAGTRMDTGYVAEGIGYTRWSRRSPQGPVIAHPVQACPCAECSHPKYVHEEGDDPVTPGLCLECTDDDAHHDYTA
jgi:hypothetical protein